MAGSGSATPRSSPATWGRCPSRRSRSRCGIRLPSTARAWRSRGGYGGRPGHRPVRHRAHRPQGGDSSPWIFGIRVTSSASLCIYRLCRSFADRDSTWLPGNAWSRLLDVSYAGGSGGLAGEGVASRGDVRIDERLPTQLAPADRTDLPTDGATRGRVVRPTRHPSRPGVVLLDRGGGGGRPVLLVGGNLP